MDHPHSIAAYDTWYRVAGVLAYRVFNVQFSDNYTLLDFTNEYKCKWFVKDVRDRLTEVTVADIIGRDPDATDHRRLVLRTG